MTDNAQTRVNYIQGQHASVTDRHAARTAEQSAKFVLPHLDKLPPNFSLLDLGCGPGSITTDLALRYPNAKITGIDSGDIVIAKAQELAKQRAAANVVFKHGDILDLDGLIEWGSYDVVYCNQVLIHMQKPIEGLKVMKRAAKPEGGVVAAREGDLIAGALFYPMTKGTMAWRDAMLEMSVKNGSNPGLGREMVSAALKAGWKRDQIVSSCGTDVLDTYGERKVFADSLISSISNPEVDTRKRVLAMGIMTEDQLTEVADDWRAWLASEDAWGGFVSVQVLCTNS